MLFLFYSITVSQETNLDSFLGIKWGANSSTIKKIMQGKQGVTIDKKNSNMSMLIYDGGSFGGEDVYFWQFPIENDIGFYAVTVNYKTQEFNVIRLYRKIRESISLKYGDPGENYENFTTPYHDGDGYETQAIQMGKGSFICSWKLNTELDYPNKIMLSINENLLIQLTYYNGALFNTAIERAKKKNASEF